MEELVVLKPAPWVHLALLLVGRHFAFIPLVLDKAPIVNAKAFGFWPFIWPQGGKFLTVSKQMLARTFRALAATLLEAGTVGVSS